MVAHIAFAHIAGAHIVVAYTRVLTEWCSYSGCSNGRKRNLEVSLIYGFCQYAQTKNIFFFIRLIIEIFVYYGGVIVLRIHFCRHRVLHCYIAENQK